MNGSYPERIVVFRDGVGDGDLNVVRDSEVDQLSSCFESCGADYRPYFAVIVVQKRINTKLFSYRVNLQHLLCVRISFVPLIRIFLGA